MQNIFDSTFKRELIKIAASLLLIATTSAHAVPVLQLDIKGGTYDAATETIMASSNTFSLYAYGLSSGSQKVSLTDTFYISMAVIPQIAQPGGSYGSFEYSMNGGTSWTTVRATQDMTWGSPPLESILGGAAWDSGDLSPHGIFPAYFAEKGFQFSAANQSGQYNTQDNSGSGPIAGTGMYYQKIDFKIAGLDNGFGIHFDFYNETLISSCKSKSCTVGDIDINKFAPFSHDAQAMKIPVPVVTPIPEPEIYVMMGVGLGLLGLVGRRRRQQAA